MTDLATQVRRLARRIAKVESNALQAVCRPDVLRRHWCYEEGRPCEVIGGTSGQMADLLRAVEGLLRPAGEDRPLVLELRLDRTRSYEFRHTFVLDPVSLLGPPTELVLDADYRYPNHPLPGMPAPPGVAVSDRPTDPEVLGTVRGLVDEFVARYRQIKGRPPEFRAGHAEEEIVAAETAIGMRLPEDVRALYRTIGDDVYEHGLLGVQRLQPLDWVVKEYLAGVPGTRVGYDDLFEIGPVVFDTHPAGRVRRVSRSDWWVTIGSDFACNMMAVDLDPAAGGTPGQLIQFGRDFHGPVGYVADSVTSLLRRVLDAVRAGAYEDEPDSSYLETTDAIGDTFPVPYDEVCGLDGRTAADAVAELEDHSLIQMVVLNDAEAVDLADLAPLRNLREVSVNRTRAVDLALPRDLPVESLWVGYRGPRSRPPSTARPGAVDLALLAGHPTLWSLTLEGLIEPIVIEPLAALPALAHLDLSGVEVTDLDRVATLPALRVLVLNRRQWRLLAERGIRPAALAGARLSDHALLAEAVEWATWLRTGTAGPAAPPICGTV